MQGGKKTHKHTHTQRKHKYRRIMRALCACAGLFFPADSRFVHKSLRFCGVRGSTRRPSYKSPAQSAESNGPPRATWTTLSGEFETARDLLPPLATELIGGNVCGVYIVMHQEQLQLPQQPIRETRELRIRHIYMSNLVENRLKHTACRKLVNLRQFMIVTRHPQVHCWVTSYKLQHVS